MIQQQNDIVTLLKHLRGQEFRSVEALIFVYENVEETEHPQSLSFTFSLSKCCILECASDGEAIKFHQGHLVESDLAEFGRQVVRDISSEPAWGQYIGRKVHNAFVVELDSQIIIGIGLKFDDESSLFILNFGDELFIVKEINDCLLSEPNIEVRIV